MSRTSRTAIVTGGGRGIGLGCAIQLAAQGVDIVLNDRPGSPDLEAAASQIRAHGRQCAIVEADVFQRSGCEQLVQAAIDFAGRIDILISNPAYSCRGTFLDYPVEDFERTIQGTLVAGFHISQLVARHMIACCTRSAGADDEHTHADSNGKIVFISSVQAELPISLCAPYGAAKAGLNHMMRTIAVELAEYRINVNAIEPGWIDTPGEHATFGDQKIAEAAAALPWGRLGLPEEIGKAAAFLASNDANYITGSVIPVDGLFRYQNWRPKELIARRDEP